MELGDHLFSAQMAVYRSKYTSLLVPDASIMRSSLITLESVSGTPSDEQVTKVQDAIRSYQKYSEIPSMFEPGVNAELSQHLFDIQLARYMHRAARRQPSMRPYVTSHLTSGSLAVSAPERSENDTVSANNAETGDSVVTTGSHPIDSAGIRDIFERSNQLAERANQLLERSNELIERSTQSFERNNQLIEQSNLPAEQFAETTESPSTNSLSERLGELLGQLKQYFERSNQLAEGAKTPMEQIGDTLKSINKVLVGLQHATVRSHKGNTHHAIRSLVNEKGDTPIESSWIYFFESTANLVRYNRGSDFYSTAISDEQVMYLLRFYGIEGDFFEDSAKTRLLEEKRADAR
ncbi:unnamed protein product, partial [Rhizoctonia solani]